jgi:type IV secretion system protein VirB4
MDILSLSLGMGLGAAAVRVASGLREHRADFRSVADLLNWGFLVDDGPTAVVLQKDGSLVAGWRYRGPDLGAATSEDLDALMSHVNDALLPFCDNWMFHIDAIRRPASTYRADRFPDAVSQLIDDERREAYTKDLRRSGGQFETSYYIVATYLPPSDVVARLGSIFVQEANTSAAPDKRDAWTPVLSRFRSALSSIDVRLSSRLSLVPLDARLLLTHLHECLTGSSRVVAPPPHGAFLDGVLADEQLVGGFEPSVGAKAIRVVAMHGYPDRTRAGELDALNALGFAFRWSTRIIPIGTHEAARIIRRHQLQWFKKRKGAAAWAQELLTGNQSRTPNADASLWMDHDARAMAEDASEAATANARGDVRFCYVTHNAVIMHDDPQTADSFAGDLVKSLADSGFGGRVENINALDAFMGTMPGNGYANLRRPLLSTRNVADLLPLTSVWPGLNHNPNPLFPEDSPPLLWAKTAGSTPFRLNIHDSDVGHTLIFGPTGGGKSVLLGLLAAQFRRYEQAQVFVFDVGYSMWTLAEASGALHHDIAAGRPDVVRLQPLASIDDPAERIWAMDWLETVFELQGLTLTPQLRSRLARALELLARNDPQHRTLTELSVQVQHEALASALRPYTVAGDYGELLDSRIDSLDSSDFEVFELKHLLALDDRAAVPVLLYLFRRIEKRLGTRPTLIAIDEAWVALVHSAFGRRINQWLLTLRKQNAAVVLATQSPSQLAELASRHTVLDSCPTRIYLPNADALSPGQAPLYRELGLNTRQIECIARATPKRHYYFTSPRGNRLFELGLGPVALAFLAGRAGSTIDETRRAINALSQADSAWPADWLDALGQGEWADRMRALIDDARPSDILASSAGENNDASRRTLAFHAR